MRSVEMTAPYPEPVQRLVRRGVEMPAPHTVHVDRDVDPSRIAPGAVLHAGTRLFGADTLIGPGCVIGREQPVTLRSCRLGHGVSVAGGSVEGATLLDGASLGSGTHVRAGTLMEEQAVAAHTVGLKQTILFPFVTLGSLINFCDCLMAGGTSRKRHSEVGSSYVHFNFTPHGDKATASLVGDVPRGVMLDQPPIFLGGQGGLVGPSRVGYGCTVAAGAVLRGDALDEGRLVCPRAPAPAGSVPYPIGVYRDIRRIVRNGLIYLGNLQALRCWYRQVRTPFARGDDYREACVEGALLNLDLVYRERVQRLEQLADKLPASAAHLAEQDGRDAGRAVAAQRDFHAAWPALKEGLLGAAGSVGAEQEAPRGLVERLAGSGNGAGYVEAVQALEPGLRTAGSAWLQGIVDSVSALWHPTAS